MDVFQQDEHACFLRGRVGHLSLPDSSSCGGYNQQQSDDQAHERQNESGGTATDDEAEGSPDD